MTPREFVDKWRAVDQKERSTAQSHFNDLCDLLGEPKPLDDDPKGERYAFEKGADKTDGGKGWADVWRRHCFAWEYKGKHKDLDKALDQVKRYATALENPPLLVTCDIERIVVTTNWTNTVSTRREVKLEDLLIPAEREFLKQVLRGDDRLRSKESRVALTKDVASKFAGLARELQDAGHEPLTVAHFVNRLVFCMFAEDAGLLGEHLFSKLLDAARPRPDDFAPLAGDLFRAMSRGGRLGLDTVAYFNGGLFEDDTALPLTRKQIDLVRSAAVLDWTAVDPSILGTLFERGLDPAKRSQLGAHYTDPENIMRIVNPVVLRPLAQEWEDAKVRIASYRSLAKRREVFEAYLARLRGVTVLDPACGSGNFLYLALRGLKDLEHDVLIEAEALGFGRRVVEIGPEVLRGIELNIYAAELARVSIWIGQLQWQIEHGYGVERNPILKPLDAIENRDALLDLYIERPEITTHEELVAHPEPLVRRAIEDTKSEVKMTLAARWPDAEFIIGNPPFLGGKMLRRNMGDEYVDHLHRVYGSRIPTFSDLVCYWFEKARAQIEWGRSKRAGLIATQGIRGGANRRVLERIKETGDIFFAWSDLDWILEGANVHVSIIGFDDGSEVSRTLDGIAVPTIEAGLAQTELHIAKSLTANLRLAFIGIQPSGSFELTEGEADELLHRPNINGNPSSNVLRPWMHARRLLQSPQGPDEGTWTIDFGAQTEMSAMRYDGPFEIVRRVAQERTAKHFEGHPFFRYWRRRPEMGAALAGLTRYIVTPHVSKHRIFAWLGSEVLPSNLLIAIAVEDDYTFGVLHSRFHELWARAQGTQLREAESGFRYTPTTCFETFPFPEPTDAQRAAVADAARDLDALREAWLNPPEWTHEETLVFPATVGGPWDRWIPASSSPFPWRGRGVGSTGGADGAGVERPATGSVAEARYVRRVAKPGAAKMVAARTLTKLYNERPAWLRHAHDRLDAAVAQAYNLPPDLPDADLLTALLKLNLERAIT